MISDTESFLTLATYLYGESLPKPISYLRAPALLAEGLSVQATARALSTTQSVVRGICESNDLFAAIMGTRLVPVEPDAEKRLRSTIGQLMLGSLAEQVFEEVYRVGAGSSELELRDDRESRGDTDYYLYNGGGRQIFRVNIKFFGSIFRKADELVSLDPADCFALATYKIHMALRKQEAEHLPYIFVIVGVPNLTGPVVGTEIPEDVVHFLHLATTGKRKVPKRDLEDLIVAKLQSDPRLGFESSERFLAMIRSAQWYILGARRADLLLKEKLFERAYALRVRAFARNYRGAELDMHFSLSSDLTKLEQFFAALRDEGLVKLGTKIERGTI